MLRVQSAYAAGVWGVSSAGGWPADCGAGHAEVWQGLRDENLVHMACSGYEHDDDQDDDDQVRARTECRAGGWRMEDSKGGCHRGWVWCLKEQVFEEQRLRTPAPRPTSATASA